MLPGQKCGGLTESSAQRLGLPVGLPVATSIIDAHAGCLALIASKNETETDLIGKLGKVVYFRIIFVCLIINLISMILYNYINIIAHPI